MPRPSNMTLVGQQPRKTTAKKETPAPSKVTYQGVLELALSGVSVSVEALTDIVKNDQSDPKDKIAAAKTLAHILVQLADATVTEKLPLLEELERNVRQTA